jgi:hypothetical protein
MTQQKKYQVATVTLKKLIWNGKKKVQKGTVFKDDKCFEGKYHPDTADVVFLEPEPEPEPEPELELESELEPRKIELEVPIPTKRGRGRPPKTRL